MWTALVVVCMVVTGTVGSIIAGILSSKKYTSNKHLTLIGIFISALLLGGNIIYFDGRKIMILGISIVLIRSQAPTIGIAFAAIAVYLLILQALFRIFPPIA